MEINRLSTRSITNKSSQNGPKLTDAPSKWVKQAKDLLVSLDISSKAQEAAISMSGQLAKLLPQESSPHLSQRGPSLPDRPGVYFLSGLKIPGINEWGGMLTLASEVENGRHFTWKEADKIVQEIKEKNDDEPIIIIGHGLGSDTAVDIARILNEDDDARKVDLLVTIDSVGLDNDIIPANVRSNLNFVSNNDPLFNDSANIAEDDFDTEVENTLIHEEDHFDLEESYEVKDEVTSAINDIILKKELAKNLRAKFVK